MSELKRKTELADFKTEPARGTTIINFPISGASASTVTNKKILVDLFNKATAPLDTSDTPSIIIERHLSNLKTTHSIANATIYDLGTDEYNLTESILAVLTLENGEYFASIPDLEIRSEGTTEFEAIRNLKLELIDLYDDLNSFDENELGKELKAQKRVINHLIGNESVN